MPLFRRLLPVFVAACVVVAGPIAPVSAAGDYRGAVSIHFPTVSSARYSNDFANPRSGGRVHRATDLFAAAGSPVYAARGGTVIWLPRVESGNAGFAIQVRGDDGRVYAYYHLGRAGGRYRRAIAADVKLFGQVSRGQLLGRLGDSGNAAGGSPHLHFEIQDDGVVDPYGTNRRNPYNSLRKAQGLSQDKNQALPVPPSARPALKLGDRGPAVTKWQGKLNRSGRTGAIVADGIFGSGTQRATIRFQKSVGLGPDGLGVVGKRTQRKMRRVLRRNNATSSPTPKPKATHVRRSGAPVLRLGDRGRPVRVWQKRLNRSGRTGRIQIDGAFGRGTRRATVTFQKSAGLGPNGLGIVGPKTRAAMVSVLRRR